LHGDDELVAQRLVQLEGARRAKEQRVGPVHPQQGGAGTGSSPPLQAAQYGLRHGDIRLGTHGSIHACERGLSEPWKLTVIFFCFVSRI
jgi:hypothetical protein